MKVCAKIPRLSPRTMSPQSARQSSQMRSRTEKFIAGETSPPSPYGAGCWYTSQTTLVGHRTHSPVTAAITELNA